jgi:hypothetical protein
MIEIWWMEWNQLVNYFLFCMFIIQIRCKVLAKGQT